MSGLIRRLSVLNIHIVGVVVAIVLGVILYFGPIKRAMADIQVAKDAATTAQGAGGTQDEVAKQRGALKAAQKKSSDEMAKWLADQNQYMPDLDLSDPALLQSYETKLIKIPAEWGKWLEGWYDAQRNAGISRAPGVDFPVDAFPADPNYLSQIQSLRFPQNGAWSVTVVAKSFDAAMAHLRRFSGMRRHGVPVVDNVVLAGQSPDLVLTYTLSLFVIPAKLPPQADPSIVSGTGSAGGPGALGVAGSSGARGGSAGGEATSGAMGAVGRHHGRDD